MSLSAGRGRGGGGRRDTGTRGRGGGTQPELTPALKGQLDGGGNDSITTMIAHILPILSNGASWALNSITFPPAGPTRPGPAQSSPFRLLAERGLTLPTTPGGSFLFRSSFFSRHRGPNVYTLSHNTCDSCFNTADDSGVGAGRDRRRKIRATMTRNGKRSNPGVRSLLVLGIFRAV